MPGKVLTGDEGAPSARTTPPPGQFVHIELAQNGSLVISKVALIHAGTYECHVSNMAGDDRIQYSLKASPFCLAPTIGTKL